MRSGGKTMAKKSKRGSRSLNWNAADMAALVQFIDALDPAVVGFIPAVVTRLADEAELLLGTIAVRPMRAT